MSINAGTYKVGEGHTYENLSVAFADVASPLVGNLTFEVSNFIEGQPKALLDSINFGSHTVTINCPEPHEGVAIKGIKIEMGSNTECMHFNNCTNGNLLIQDLNIQQAIGASVGTAYRVISFTGISQDINVLIDDLIINGGNRDQTALHVEGPIGLRIFNVIIYDCGYGIEQTNNDPTTIIENVIIHNVGTALIIPSGKEVNVNNTCCVLCATDLTVIGGPSNISIGKNNATTGSSLFGFDTEVDTVTAYVIASEFWSVNPLEYNYLRLKNTGVLSEGGLAFDDLLIDENEYGIRGNARGIDGLTSIGSDESVKAAEVKLRNVPPQGAFGNPAAHIIPDALSENRPDYGDNYVETRLYIKDHGRETPGEAGREPQWVDFTEFGGLYRIDNVPEIINIGTEGVKPFRFQASSINIKLNNTDYAWDNLKTFNLKTVDGLDAKFLQTEKGTNLDLQFRPAKIVTKFPKEEMTVGYDLAHFKVESIETNSNGSASIKLESLEKEFIEKKADSVKDGKNWYFDRSVKFLVEELIKSVRREYLDGQERLTGSDIVSLSGIETGEEDRTFSEFGRPVVSVNSTATGITQGEKRLIVTAAAPRNIFISTLQGNVSAGSNYIRIMMDNAIVIKKGDVITLGNATAGTFNEMNSEKVTVLQDVTFGGSHHQQNNVKVSTLKKNHYAGETVERWIIYLGCTRAIEDTQESYVVTFDPDRDEYSFIMDSDSTTAGDSRLLYPPRFMNFKQTLRINGIPGPDEPGNAGGGQRLALFCTPYSFPGKPNEPGMAFIWGVDNTKQWNEPHLVRKNEATIPISAGGVYTGEMNFRATKPLLTREYLGVVNDNERSKVAPYGAVGVGKFVEEVMHANGTKSFGFGYMAGLAADIEKDTNVIKVSTVASGSKWWAVHSLSKGPDLISSGYVYVIGGNENSDGYSEGIGETFHHDLNFYSGKITSTTCPETNVIQYTIDPNNAPEKFSKNNSVVIVIPDTGKMYVGNLGENTVIPEPQNLNVAEWLGNTETNESLALDTNTALPAIYADTIKHEKKTAIDRAKSTFVEKKKKVDSSSIDAGYYSTIIEKSKLEVNIGDVISEANIDSSKFRLVPGQYTAMPFATELYRIDFNRVPTKQHPTTSDLIIKRVGEFPGGYNGIFGDNPPIVYEGTTGPDINGNLPDISHPYIKKLFDAADYPYKNRNVHVWNYPIIGLWSKYQEINKSLTSFDGSIIADNGNAELLGYWYLDYNSPLNYPEESAERYEVPWLQVAYADAEGIVHVVNSEDLPAEHLPLCTVLHNITYHNGGPGNKFIDFYGNMSDAMQGRLIKILGGTFEVFATFQDGSPLRYSKIIGLGDNGASATTIPYSYCRWHEGASLFLADFPKDMSIGPYAYSKVIKLKFKKLRDPQAKGSLFVGLHCYPVRPRHLHLPHGNSSFDGGINKEIKNNKSNTEITPPIETTFAYAGKVVDTNFENGSEEILNKGVNDSITNIWVLDRYSQRKSLGIFIGTGETFEGQGILKGAKLNTVGVGEREIEIPLGYKGTAAEASAPGFKYDVDTVTYTLDHFASDAIEASTNILTAKMRFNLTTAHSFTNKDIGSLIKLDGMVDPTTPHIFNEWHKTLDGVFKITAIPSSTQIEVLKYRINHPYYDSGWALNGTTFIAWINAGATGIIRRYYGITANDLNFLDSRTAKIYSETDPPSTALFIDTYRATPSDLLLSAGTTYAYSDTGIGAVEFVNENPAGKLVFTWNKENGFPESTGTAPYELNKLSGSGPAVMLFSAVTAYGADIDIPEFKAQHIDHRDHLYGVPSGSVTYPIPFSKTFLSYHKTIFTAPPSFGDVINYPRALCGRSWNKFWKYHERRNTEEFKGIEKQYAIGKIEPLDNMNEYISKTEYPRGTIFTGKNANYSIPRPPNDMQWNEYVEFVINDANNSGIISASRETGISEKFDAIYFYNDVDGVGNSGIVARILEISLQTGKNRLTIDTADYNHVNEMFPVGSKLFIHNYYGMNYSINNTFFIVENIINSTIIEGQAYYKETCNPSEKTFYVAEKNKFLKAANNYSLSFYTLSATGNDLTDRNKQLRITQLFNSSFGTNIAIGEENPYGEGDGKFDSEIKPCNFSDTFINSMAKWYLSRFDSGNKILCDTYTMNHDTPFLGNDDKLYAIVNRHPNKTPVISRFPFIKFSLNAQGNFAVSQNGDQFYFAKAFFQTDANEFQIMYQLRKFTEALGAQSLVNTVVQPTGLVDLNSLLSDWEIHGIFTPGDNSGNISFGIMQWINKRNVNMETLVDPLRAFLPEHTFFSNNFLMVTTDNGNSYTKIQWREYPDAILSYADGPVDASTWTIKTLWVSKTVEVKPLQVKRGSAVLTEGDPSNVNEWSATFNSATKWYEIKIGGTSPDDLKFCYADPTRELSNDYRSIRYGAAGDYAFLSFIKGWTGISQDYLIDGFTKKALRGIIMKRHQFLSPVEAERNKREDLLAFHIEISTGALAYFEGQGDSMFPYSLTKINEFAFRVSGEDGYYFTNNYDNGLSRWNGQTKSGGSLIAAIGGGAPVVEGDFNQYYSMIKLPTAYEEIFGFSMGTRGHLAAQGFKGGRNIIWKLSRALAFHIAVADFSDLSVWDALGNLAELTDCVVGFDRFGNLHFEPRPEVTDDTAFFFTFDNIDNQNIISISKKPPFQHIYNEIEVIPYKPALPDVTASLTTQSDLNVVTVNHDLFIKDKSIDYNEKSPNKARPDIVAFQKDFKRKRILLICTNGQFNSQDAESRGLYSRFKYHMIDDLIEVRLAENAVEGATEIKVNQIPFDNTTNQPSFSVEDKIYIGEYEFLVETINTNTRVIGISPAIPTGVLFQSGMSANIATREQQDNIYHADGSGVFPGKFNGRATGMTYSPKTFFTEVGEWTFDEGVKRNKKAVLTADIGPASRLIPVDDVSIFPDTGYVSIAGKLIAYSGVQDTALMVNGPISTDVSAGTQVIPMPVTPYINKTANDIYNPGELRAGGYDELGPSCLNEYHMLDPNEDGQPYFNGDPHFGGQPITALEFYSRDAEDISYRDQITVNAAPYIITNADNKVRHRTYVNMKINFNGFRFNDGDKIELDVPGIKLEAQTHLKKVFANAESIKRNGLRQYPQTNNRFFNNSTASTFAKKNLSRISKIGSEVELKGYINDINDLDWLRTIRIIDSRMFGGYPGSQVIGYINNMSFNQNTGIVTLNIFTQET